MLADCLRKISLEFFETYSREIFRKQSANMFVCGTKYDISQTYDVSCFGFQIPSLEQYYNKERVVENGQGDHDVSWQKVRLSQKTARQRRQSHFSATVSLFCDRLTFLRHCGQGLRSSEGTRCQKHQGVLLVSWWRSMFNINQSIKIKFI